MDMGLCLLFLAGLLVVVLLGLWILSIDETEDNIKIKKIIIYIYLPKRNKKKSSDTIQKHNQEEL